MMVFNRFNLLNSSRVTTSFEVGIQESLHHLPSQIIGYEATWQGKDIGIVMLSCQFG
jgi:hypothetical protein